MVGDVDRLEMFKFLFNKINIDLYQKKYIK